MLIFFKLAIYALGLFSLVFLIAIPATGLRMAWNRRRKNSSCIPIAVHKLCFCWLWNATLLTLVIVFVFRFFLPEIGQHPPIFKIHIRYFAPEFFIALLAIRAGVNGDRFPKFHRWVAYPCVFWGIGTNVIGIYMNHLLPW